MKKLLFALALIPGLALQAQKKNKKPSGVEALTPVLATNVDSFSYAAGMNIAQNMKGQGIDTVNGAMLVRAMEEVFSGKKPLMTDDMANQTLQQTMQAYMEKKAAACKQKESAFFAENKKRKEIIEGEGGMQYEVLKAGDPAGMKPKGEDTVVVNYKGTLLDGTEFDNSFKRGEPATFPVNGVISGWTKILQMMTKGSNWKVYIPAQMAYGERGAGGAIPPNSTLIFEIDLLDIKPASGK